MTEAIFKFDINVDKFKTYVSKNFTAKQLEDFIGMVYMYVEIIGTEEMSQRIHTKNYHKKEDTEVQLQGVVELAETLGKFLKKSGQSK